MKDLQLQNPELFEMVKEESLRQIKKWGIQNRDPFEWLAYTTEELGELSWAISEYEYREGMISNIIKEAIQVATLSLKIAEMYLNAPIPYRRVKPGGLKKLNRPEKP